MDVYRARSELNSCLNGIAGAKTQAQDFVGTHKHTHPFLEAAHCKFMRCLTGRGLCIISALNRIVESLWTGDNSAHRPVLVGPDTHSAAEFQSTGLEWFNAFVKESKANGDVVSRYSKSLLPTVPNDRPLT
jgi:hypothetical protein